MACGALFSVRAMRSAAVSQQSCRALARLLRALCTVPGNPPTGCSPVWVPQKSHIEFDNASCLSSYLMVALSATISQARFLGFLQSEVAWVHCFFLALCNLSVKLRLCSRPMPCSRAHRARTRLCAASLPLMLHLLGCTPNIRALRETLLRETLL